jgi:hypothetical protein
MSAPPAGKFQDHYAILGIDPKSDLETIQRAYAKLVQKYPNNSATGNPEMLDALNWAYEVLSDREQRSVFDKMNGDGQRADIPKFSGVDFFDALGHEAALRAAILCVLYDRRLNEPSRPSLSTRHLELIVEASAVRLSSALWYLKQRGLAASDDKSNLQITVDGMDFLVTKSPLPVDVMPFIKPAAIAISQIRPPQAQPVHAHSEKPAVKGARESVLASLIQGAKA